jgi:hypothetical protein
MKEKDKKPSVRTDDITDTESNTSHTQPNSLVKHSGEQPQTSDLLFTKEALLEEGTLTLLTQITLFYHQKSGKCRLCFTLIQLCELK